MNQAIRCWIYKSPRKNEMYLYLPEKDKFSDLPTALVGQFGTPQFVMELELDPERKLARADAKQVISDLESQGFHLQMPPRLDPDLYHGNDL